MVMELLKITKLNHMKKIKLFSVLLLLVLTTSISPLQLHSQTLKENPALDEQVKMFLKNHSYMWRDLNIPSVDGQTIYDLIVKNNYKTALEIGTSTGHSGIWTAWALSKTGGKLITVELDETRYKTALANFKEAGLSEYIDARLGDAHVLVPQLTGPFDFVFSDADKEWYKNYFIALDPKLKVGGCFTAHNISQGGRWGQSGQSEFLNYIQSLTNYETTVNSSGGGLSISYKKATK
jgi:caffeoyl-CoA O-methyltransferase